MIGWRFVGWPTGDERRNVKRERLFGAFGQNDIPQLFSSQFQFKAAIQMFLNKNRVFAADGGGLLLFELEIRVFKLDREIIHHRSV